MRSNVDRQYENICPRGNIFVLLKILIAPLKCNFGYLFFFSIRNLVLPIERCKLICKVADDRLERSFVLGDRVEDGTPCGLEEETRDICISGVCMPVGCDHKYGSNATEDVCGVCNGQNKTCKLVSGSKTVTEFGKRIRIFSSYDIHH